MPFARARGVNIHYQTSGTGPAVILVHAFTANSAFWYLTIAPWLARDFHVVTYDLRGHGKSDMPPEGYTSAHMAEDLHGLVMHLGLGGVHLVGHSFGGEIALQYAAKNPGLVRSVTLADARVRTLQPRQPLIERPRWNLIRDKLKELGVTRLSGRPQDNDRLFDELTRAYVRDMETFGPFGLGSWRRRDVERLVRLACATTADQDLQSDAGLTREMLHGIRPPILAIYGARSGFLTTLRGLQRAVPQCRTIVVPGVGHFLPVLRPGLFVGHVRGFIRQTDRPHRVARLA
jgi:pimeloyl-ACP methyl ester carboxylesterase